MCKKKENVCKGSTTLIFSCSGAADVGLLADQVTRKMTKDRIGKMYCLAGIGGNVNGIIQTTKAADKLLAIDGCPVACAKKILENNGFNDFEYMELTSMGFEKGKSPLNEKSIEKIIETAKEKMA